MIRIVSGADVVRKSKTHLGLDPFDPNIDQSMLACLIRRIVNAHAPILRATIIDRTMECLQLLENDREDLVHRIQDTYNQMLIFGDLIEARDSPSLEGLRRGTVVFGAPLSLTVQSNRIFLIGVFDERECLPDYLSNYLQHDCHRRFLSVEDINAAIECLMELGFSKVTDDQWLKGPVRERPHDLIARYNKLLYRTNSAFHDVELEIIDGTSQEDYYRARWRTPLTQSGIFVGRRPTAYGGFEWCYVQLEGGVCVRLLDFSLVEEEHQFERSCDKAWRLQMALDYESNRPQSVALVEEEDEMIFDFVSPIPLWTERRFLKFGRRIEGRNSLVSFAVPMADSTLIKKFLQEFLWLKIKR
jgi:hypothetical protein